MSNTVNHTIEQTLSDDVKHGNVKNSDAVRNLNTAAITDPSTIQWLRGFRLNGIAAFDLIVTGISAYVMALGVKYISQFSTTIVTSILFILLMISAVLIHVISDVPTMLNHYIGINTLEEVIDGREKRGEPTSI